MSDIKLFHHSYFRNFLLLFFLNNFFVPLGHAQNNLQSSLDVAQFQDSKHRHYLEIYYAIPEQSITYVSNDNGEYSSLLLMDLQIHKNDSLWATQMWKYERTIEDTMQLAENKQMVDMFRYFLDGPGTYHIVVHARDMNQENVIDSTASKIECKKFSPNKLELSDVQLASQIKKLSNESSKVFAKKNYEVIPNPTSVFGEGVPILYYYFEAYNLLNNVAGSQYKCFAFLKDSHGNIVEGLGPLSRTKTKLRDFSIEMGQINMSKLSTGKYFLDYGISDSTGAELINKEKNFYIYNPSVPPTLVTKAGTRVQDLVSEELDQEYEYMRYLTKKKDREFYKNLTNPGAKKQFIYSSWQSQTSHEGLKGMYYRQLYLLRVKEANKRFGALGKEGWKTDQGRVYILYGEPTNIERFPSTPTNKPYQIWTYNYLLGQGGVIFVFADRFGFNRYELVHSTLREELQDPFWQRFIVVGPQDGVQPGRN